MNRMDEFNKRVRWLDFHTIEYTHRDERKVVYTHQKQFLLIRKTSQGTGESTPRHTLLPALIDHKPFSNKSFETIRDLLYEYLAQIGQI
ncbi:MAG: hypothetical protein OXH31_09645 [Gammaproteobacteria bacterium]|nr:hypothetical protein [Gammaproteobacteria bacterium]